MDRASRTGSARGLGTRAAASIGLGQGLLALAFLPHPAQREGIAHSRSVACIDTFNASPWRSQPTVGSTGNLGRDLGSAATHQGDRQPQQQQQMEVIGREAVVVAEISIVGDRVDADADLCAAAS